MRKRTGARFKRGDRVEWTTAGVRNVGEVRDVHKLGGYGWHYEVRADGPRAQSEEVPEGELAPLALLDRMAEAAAQDAQATGVRRKPTGRRS